MGVTYSGGKRDDRLVHRLAATETVMEVLPEAWVCSVPAPRSIVLTGWTWFVRRDIGEEALRDLDEALAAPARQDEGHDRTTR